MLVQETPSRESLLLLLALVSTLLLSMGCDDPNRTAVIHVMNETKADHPISLPRPSQQGERSLGQTLATRRSVRNFTNKPLTDHEISQLLWAAQGITNDEGLRTAPSAGALYPLELYVATSTGLYQYDPLQHELRQDNSADLRQSIYHAALEQDSVREAPAVFIFTAVYARTAQKYGDRAQRYVHIEVGHAAQNLLLKAVALDLAAVPIGAFDDDQLSKLLKLPGEQFPLYLIPVGHPR